MIRAAGIPPNTSSESASFLTRLRDILTARRRLQWVATGVVATVVTLLVVVPLTARAIDARGDDGRPASAPTDGIIATLGATSGDLNGSVVSGAPVITFDLEGLGAVAYRLVAEDGDEIAAGVDDLGPDYSLTNTPEGLAAALDTTALANGEYTVFATLTLVDDDGETTETYRMATFEVDNDG